MVDEICPGESSVINTDLITNDTDDLDLKGGSFDNTDDIIKKLMAENEQLKNRIKMLEINKIYLETELKMVKLKVELHNMPG